MDLLNILLTVTLSAMLVETSGLFCEYPPCELVKCNFVPTDCNGTIRSGGGYCGCCEACFVENLGAGEGCDLEDKWYPATNLCKTGFKCDYNTSTCTEIPGHAIG